MDTGPYVVQKQDVPKACEALTQAFAQDPFYSYITEGEDHDLKIAGFFHLFTLNYGLAYGVVHAPGPDVEAVAIWLPPGRTHITAWGSVRAGLPTLMKAGPLKAARHRGMMSKLAKYGSYAEKIHGKHAPFPHWYLMVLGVADAHRGRGFASRLLKPMLDRIDREGLPCYLETHNPANPPIYEHFGFTVKEVGSLPGSDRPHWAMLRQGTPGARPSKGAR